MLYVVQINIVSRNSQIADLSDYKCISSNNQNLNLALQEAIRIFYFNSQASTDLVTSYNVIESSSFELLIQLVFDYDRLVNNLQNTIGSLKKVINDKFNESVTNKDGLPTSPVFTISSDSSLSSVNIFDDAQNAGGWSLIYFLESPTQTTTTTLPVSEVEQPITSTTQTEPFEPESQQSTGRQERTGEDPNDQNRNITAAPPGISNLFKNTYFPPSIELNFPSNDAARQEAAKNTGFVPFVWYNSYQIAYSDISYFLLSNDGLIPIVKIIFTDSLNLMRDKGMPLDDSKIKVFLNPRSSKLKPILLQFKITVFKIDDDIYTLAGVLDIDKLYQKEFRSYSNQTSFEALNTIFREMGLGFNTNIDNTDDSMTWINTGERNYNFITEMLETCYKSDESYLTGYIDFYYHFNYVDIEKELNRNIKEELGIGSFGLEEAANIKDQEKLSSFFLTNDMSRENSNMYISDYKIINNSTNVSLLEGYFTRVKYYDDIKKDLLVFDVDSITSKGDKIILKGAPQDINFFNSNVNLMYLGKIDSDNSHKNYNYSYVQNLRNITELQKIVLNLELSTPNYNIFRFQKVNVILTNTPTPSQKGFNNRLSGEWFIVDVQFEMNDGRFVQKLQLVRRDLDLSPEELLAESDQTQKPSTENVNSSVENTSNPTDLNNTDVAEISSEETQADLEQTTQTTAVQTDTTTTITQPVDNFDLDYIITDTSVLKTNNGQSVGKLVLIGNAVVVEDVAIAFYRMQQSARIDGVSLRVNSGFRPAFGPKITVKSKKGKTVEISTQESIRAQKKFWIESARAKYASDQEYILKAPSREFKPQAAPPGVSNHGNGIALDIDTGSRVSYSRVLNNKGKEYIWLVKNSWKFGFVRTVGTEEWHYEYRPNIATNGPYAKVKDGESNLYYADLGLTGLKKDNLA